MKHHKSCLHFMMVDITHTHTHTQTNIWLTNSWEIVSSRDCETNFDEDD